MTACLVLSVLLLHAAAAAQTVHRDSLKAFWVVLAYRTAGDCSGHEKCLVGSEPRSAFGSAPVTDALVAEHRRRYSASRHDDRCLSSGDRYFADVFYHARGGTRPDSSHWLSYDGRTGRCLTIVRCDGWSQADAFILSWAPSKDSLRLVSVTPRSYAVGLSSIRFRDSYWEGKGAVFVVNVECGDGPCTQFFELLTGFSRFRSHVQFTNQYGSADFDHTRIDLYFAEVNDTIHPCLMQEHVQVAEPGQTRSVRDSTFLRSFLDDPR